MDAHTEKFIQELENKRDDCLTEIAEAIIDRDYNKIFERAASLKATVTSIEILVERNQP